jgi:peptidoglycan hydrolase CwlO-like protein
MGLTKKNSFKQNKILPVQIVNGPNSRDTIERAITVRTERLPSPDPLSTTLDLVNEMTNNKYAFEEKSKKLGKNLLLKVNELEQKIESYQKKIKLYKDSIAKYKSLIDKNNDELEKSFVCSIL